MPLGQSCSIAVFVPFVIQMSPLDYPLSIVGARAARMRAPDVFNLGGDSRYANGGSPAWAGRRQVHGGHAAGGIPNGVKSTQG